jgi:hypothetical protein
LEGSFLFKWSRLSHKDRFNRECIGGFVCIDTAKALAKRIGLGKRIAHHMSLILETPISTPPFL